MVTNDVVLNKIATIERCVKRVNEVYGKRVEKHSNYLRRITLLTMD